MTSITTRDYAGPDDLRAMQALVQATWTRNSHLHIGDLVWQRYPRAPKADWPTRLWFSGADPIAWVWSWGDADAEADEDGFFAVVHPEFEPLFDEALAWAETTNASPKFMTIAYQGDTPLMRALERRGYRLRDYGPFGLHTFRALDEIPEPELPPGFRAASMV